jgi:hypothetical protein
MFANQVHVDVEVNGTPRRFLFDTGSPSMMSAAIAADLGLEAVDRRQSRDSHGAIVETEIVQADLTVGGTTCSDTGPLTSARWHERRRHHYGDCAGR